MKLRIGIACTAMLVGCSGAPVNGGNAGDATTVARTECRDDITSANTNLTESTLDVAQAYARAVPPLAKLALTGALRTQTIVLKGIDDRPVASGVPEDLRALLRPLERAFDRIRLAIRAHVSALQDLRDAAATCEEGALATDDLCLAEAAGELESSTGRAIRLTRRLATMELGTLEATPARLEAAARRVQQANARLSVALGAVERCLATG